MTKSNGQVQDKTPPEVVRMPDRARPDNDHDCIIGLWDMMHEVLVAMRGNGIEAIPTRCHIEHTRLNAIEEKLACIGGWVKAIAIPLIVASLTGIFAIVWTVIRQHLHG